MGILGHSASGMVSLWRSTRKVLWRHCCIVVSGPDLTVDVARTKGNIAFNHCGIFCCYKLRLLIIKYYIRVKTNIVFLSLIWFNGLTILSVWKDSFQLDLIARDIYDWNCNVIFVTWSNHSGPKSDNFADSSMEQDFAKSNNSTGYLWT